MAILVERLKAQNWGNCALLDKAMKVGTVEEEVIREKFSYSAISDFSAVAPGNHLFIDT